MLNFVGLAALLWTSAVLAGGIDDRFASGVPSVQWGATLQQVQATYPNGLTWPAEGKDGIEAVTYAIPGDPNMLGMETPVRFVQFIFTKDNKLRTVFFSFDYSLRDAALYGVAESLGQDYTMRDEGGRKTFDWKPGRNSIAQMSIGTPPYSWAVLAVRATEHADSRK